MSRTLTGGSTGLPDSSGTCEVMLRTLQRPRSSKDG